MHFIQRDSIDMDMCYAHATVLGLTWSCGGGRVAITHHCLGPRLSYSRLRLPRRRFARLPSSLILAAQHSSHLPCALAPPPSFLECTLKRPTCQALPMSTPHDPLPVLSPFLARFRLHPTFARSFLAMTRVEAQCNPWPPVSASWWPRRRGACRRAWLAPIHDRGGAARRALR